MHERELITVAEPPFLTVQGEGALVGRPTVFVRTGGCDFRCKWCDSMHAVDTVNKKNWTPMSAAEIMVEVALLTEARPILITLSGGNPALQPLAELIDLGHSLNCTFAMETQGSVAKPWFSKLDHLILSPKPPSSGMPFRATRLEDCINAAGVRRIGNVGWARAVGAPTLSLKVVVMSEEDYAFARAIYQDHAQPLSIPFFITPGNHTPPEGAQYNAEGNEFDMEGLFARTRWLVERVNQDRWFDISIIMQQHTLLFGNRQGV